jgi:hypothetical protein
VALGKEAVIEKFPAPRSWPQRLQTGTSRWGLFIRGHEKLQGRNCSAFRFLGVAGVGLASSDAFWRRSEALLFPLSQPAFDFPAQLISVG